MVWLTLVLNWIDQTRVAGQGHGGWKGVVEWTGSLVLDHGIHERCINEFVYVANTLTTRTLR